jgi:hypothetical protein
MGNKHHLIGTRGQDSFNQEILETYKKSDESTRMDMYMTYRDLRERFEKIEINPETRQWRC